MTIPSTSATANIFRVAIDGSGQTTLVVGEADNAFRLAVDDASVYFSSKTRGIVAKVPVGGGPVTTLACPAIRSFGSDGGTVQGQPLAVAIDASSVYWVDGYFGQVLKTAK